MRYLIIGSGPAGISAAEEIRKADPEGTITLITADADPRPPRSCSPTGCRAGTPGATLLPCNVLLGGEHRVELRRGEPATAVDVERQAVTSRR